MNTTKLLTVNPRIRLIPSPPKKEEPKKETFESLTRKNTPYSIRKQLNQKHLNYLREKAYHDSIARKRIEEKRTIMRAQGIEPVPLEGFE